MKGSWRLQETIFLAEQASPSAESSAFHSLPLDEIFPSVESLKPFQDIPLPSVAILLLLWEQMYKE